MEPQYGLDSLQESRAMKAARSKNRTQEKKLAQTIQALDKHIQSRSEELMNQTCDTRNLITSINAPSMPSDTTQGNTSITGSGRRKTKKPSMTLAEFDCRMQERRDRMRRLASDRSKSPMTTTRDKAKIYQSAYSILPPADFESDMALYKQKQSMKDAWTRANSHDIRYNRSSLK